MTGIYSCDFRGNTGIIAGGNYDSTSAGIPCVAVSRDNGHSWTLPRLQHAFFGSCIRFCNSEQAVVTGHNGTFLLNIESGFTTEIKDANGQKLRYHTLRVTENGKTVWLAGSSGRIAVLSLP